MAREILPLLLDRFTLTPGQNNAVRDSLASWDGTMARDRTEPLAFALWMEFLKKKILADELGTSFDDFFGVRPTLIKSILTEQTQWCDDIATSSVETCETQVTTAWGETLGWLASQAASPEAKRWEKWHIARFDHPIFGAIPGLSGLGGFAVPTDGDDFTVNRGSFTASTSRVPFRHRHGHGYRAIYDLADLNRSQFSLAGGQSSHRLSAHFGDLLAGWADGVTFALIPPSDGHVSRLFLTPSP
jgi:penicillin amidase